MSKIIITTMETIPENCCDCPCTDHETGRFPVDTSESISNRRLTKFFDWCPHCGAKMDGGEGDDG